MRVPVAWAPLPHHPGMKQRRSLQYMLPVVAVTDRCPVTPSAWSSSSLVFFFAQRKQKTSACSLHIIKAGEYCFLQLFLSYTLSYIAPNTRPHTASQHTTDLLLQVRAKISLRDTIPGQCFPKFLVSRES